MILLASNSPRRRELIKMLELPFRVVKLKEVEERYPEDMEPTEVPVFLSKLKASAYDEPLGDDILLTADTVVVLGDEILGKPKDAEDAKRMLAGMAGRMHRVVTGVTLTSAHKSFSFSTFTDVYFSNLTPEEIEYYVDHFHPLDKAGAYGIQEWIGAVGIKKIEGSYYNVMGLPLHRLYEALKQFT